MGLDIFYNVDNDDEIFTFEYITDDELKRHHELTRTFANLMSRKNVIPENEKTELDQISQITGIDLSSISHLDEIPDLGELEEILEYDPEYYEEQKVEYEIQRSKIENNLDEVSSKITELVEKLKEKEDLYRLLSFTSFDSLNSSVYFKKENNGGDNFYTDLNNFKNFVDYARSKGTKTIWFRYS
ncbi:hypothetical protein [Chryseobacterium vaccae]|uniref:hypothetical protein n=1 Tax=Chryseobacterium vaccae TaxID=2604424 RepID=UPI001295245F|nr:hypothetical protein [Chryseobacterium vaccae]